MGLDLWSPHAGMAVPAVLVTALLLGVIHGITPDEHTWPITFSYAIGSYSTRRGLLSGLFFSAAFTVQRAIASVLAYLALASWMQSERVDSAVDVAVGVVMALAGAYILRLGRVFHLHLFPAAWSGGSHHHAWHDGASALPATGEYRAVTPGMAVVHGFVAGWGFGAFATILYTTLVPAMPSVATAWLPGVFFGLGTLVVQAAAGAAFGAWMRRHHLPESVLALVSASFSLIALFAWWMLIFVAPAFVLGSWSFVRQDAKTPREFRWVALIALVFSGGWFVLRILAFVVAQS